MRNVSNKFAYSFNKIQAPKPNETELKAYARKVNDALEGMYAQINGYIQMNNLSNPVQNSIRKSEQQIGWLVSKDSTSSSLVLTDKAINTIAQEVDINGITQRVTTIEQTAGGLTTRIESVEDGVDGVSSRVTTIDQTIDGLTVSGQGGVTKVRGDRIDTDTLSTNKIEGRVRLDEMYPILKILPMRYDDGYPSGHVFLAFAEGETIYDDVSLEFETNPDVCRIRTGNALEVTSEYDFETGVLYSYNDTRYFSGFHMSFDNGVDLENDSPYIYATGHIYPSDTSTSSSTGYRLGYTDHRWRALYARDGTYTGSDRAYKENITPIPNSNAEAFIMGLKPVVYNLKGDDPKKRHLGFIAQDVGETLNKCGMDQDYAIYEHETENHYSLNYQEFISPMVQMIQNQQKQIEMLTKRVEVLEKALEDDNR